MTRWSSQFIGMLEALRMPTQFQQGRRYARDGHVRQLTVSASLATALVADDNGHIYRARVAVRALSDADWSRIERALSQHAIYTATLLAGEVPDDLAEVFAGLGLSLFPDDLADLAMDCPCLDWRIPCRHLAAACYALGNSFDADPFGILAWRGRSREALLEGLRARYPQPAAASVEPPSPEPLAGFWTAGPRPPRQEGLVRGTVHRPDALLDELDPLRLAAGRHDIGALLRSAYRRMIQG